MSLVIMRRRDSLARFTTVCLGSVSVSGFAGIRVLFILRNLASLSWSARSQASILRTATRKHIWGAGFGNHSLMSVGAHPASLFRSTRTNHGERWAALLKPLKCFCKYDLPCLPYTIPGSARTCSISRVSTASSIEPSTAPVILSGIGILNLFSEGK